MTEYLDELRILRNKLQAGKTSLSEDERLDVLSKTTNKIIGAFNEDRSITTNNLIDELSNLFSAILDGEFHILFISNFNETEYYSLGNSLKSAYDNADNSLIASLNNLTYQYLNLLRYSEFLKRITDNNKWTSLISLLINLSSLNTRKLFEQRVAQYGKKILFNVLKGDKIKAYNWDEINSIVNVYIKSFLNLIDSRDGEPGIAFLTENSLNMALLDIACLNSGIVNVMIPANSVPQHVSFILNQTKCKFIVVSNEKQLAKLKSVKSELKFLKVGILLDGSSAEDWVLSFSEFKDLSREKSDHDLTFDLGIGSTATIMYTSGTTGEPKGIIFSQKNIVFKRFCRAIALPGIGDMDRYLAYLPLYHTFGRWLELFGTIFWGASYSFMENPSAETMIANMKLVKPSIFISIPKKWSQLYEHITTRVNIEEDSEEVINNTVIKATGGNLKWGLSAAGYLSPEIFQFFQKYGVELMSGFGMTEATGGITMTPPREYSPNSLGKALPGIEIKLADDGELLVKGEYVMPGYFDQTYEETFIDDGWFPTGDIMKMDNKGFIEIIDRKKEIYKNTKGETIAPQRIENLFREFEAIKQVFVVGDHRPFNTVLIYPDYESNTLTDMFDDQKGEFFANLIVTTNKFLASFERIVDFRITERAFSVEFGELTPKGTFKRRVIEKNFDTVIEELYQKDYYSLYLENTEIRIPNWFLRERGCLSGDLKVENSKLTIQKLDKELTFERITDHVFRIGDYSYQNRKPYIEFHDFLINPIYWLGNDELVAFTDEAILQWYRQNSEEKSIKFIGRFSNGGNIDVSKQVLGEISSAGEKSLFGLHLALIMLRSDKIDCSVEGFDYLSSLLDDQLQEIYKIAFYFLDKPVIALNSQIQKKMLLLAIEHTKINNLKALFETYLKLGPVLFDEYILEEIVKIKKCLESVDLIDEILNEKIQLQFQSKSIDDSVIPVLLDLISRFGIRHPTRYEDLRKKLVFIQLIQDWPELSSMAQSYRRTMRDGFRKWLGQNESVAVDIETGEEYGWEDVIIFEEELEEEERKYLVKSISETPILREAIFLFSKGNIVRLSNILPRGVWISKNSDTIKTTIYRVTIQTRHQGAFDILLHKNKSRALDEIRSEVNWLILAGSRFFLAELVEDFGGFWEENNFWTQKYLPGLTIDQLFTRDVKKDFNLAKEKYYYLWPFFIWNAAAAYINFWRLTSERMQLTNPTPENLIIPSHDYQLGTRFVSLSDRSEFKSFTDLLLNFYNKFVIPIEEKYPFVKRESAWKYIFPGLINAEGENEGIEILNCFLIELKDSELEDKDAIIKQLRKLLDNIKENGYIPKQLFFATKRFIRWNKLNKGASINAQATMLNELFETYNLMELENYYPETRTRFYLETIFYDSEDDFRSTMKKLCSLQHEERIPKDEFLLEIARIQNSFKLNDKETFFLTRLSYPHLKPSDSASFVHIGPEADHSANLVVQVEDNEGNPFVIRKPISPKEISKLYQLFIDATLQVTFKPEHNFLVAISDRGFIIGGLFYSYSDKKVVHMEKIVVSNRFRRKGVSEIIMYEFFNRMIDEGFDFVTTGFFRPEYFYRFGFNIEKKYSGLVKQLKEKEN